MFSLPCNRYTLISRDFPYFCFEFVQRRLLHICCMWKRVKRWALVKSVDVIHFPTYRRLMTPLETSQKHSDKRRNCSKWAKYLFVLMFSTLFNNYSLIYKEFPSFWLNVFMLLAEDLLCVGTSYIFVKSCIITLASNIFVKRCIITLAFNIFVKRLHQWLKYITNSEGSGETGRMHRLVRVFIVLTTQNSGNASILFIKSWISIFD